MVQSILDSIVDWLKGILIDCIMDNLNGMFDQINSQVGEVAANVGTTPAAWNAGVFSMIRSLSDNVVVPIAGIVLTFVLCYEFITMIIEKNNLHDFETFIFFKWIVKAFIAVELVTHTFDLTMAIFEVAQHIVEQSAGIISGTSVDFVSILGDVETQLEALEVGELLGLVVETMMLRVTSPVISLCVMLVLIGRMIEIYIYDIGVRTPFQRLAVKSCSIMYHSNIIYGKIGMHWKGVQSHVVRYKSCTADDT